MEIAVPQMDVDPEAMLAAKQPSFSFHVGSCELGSTANCYHPVSLVDALDAP
jgi:hypothetical protein